MWYHHCNLMSAPMQWQHCCPDMCARIHYSSLNKVIEAKTIGHRPTVKQDDIKAIELLCNVDGSGTPFPVRGRGQLLDYILIPVCRDDNEGITEYNELLHTQAIAVSAYTTLQWYPGGICHALRSLQFQQWDPGGNIVIICTHLEYKVIVLGESIDTILSKMRCTIGNNLGD
ncbi:uncharacterized protein LOC133299456 [Gastrolobium bilobum]|uniref:uncharacterized protein LOC133299456 n=1 Tax=Gastrolobium bilobum TaxID=150636 RepID=UPI002AB20C57|nr:uncharacterized protein LOC133299456 [Gastrolobium bilobum]